MEEIIINGKALYTPKGAAREYAAVGCNFYTGCPHDCQYCYLKRGAPSKQLGGTEVKLKKCFKDEDDAVTRLGMEMDAHQVYLQQVGIFLSFTSDPLIQEERHLTLVTIMMAQRRSIPVVLLTKNADFINDEKLMSWLLTAGIKRGMIAFGFTLTGRDDMEPNASPNVERELAMKDLHKMGFHTWASIEPIIDLESSLDVIMHTLDYCDLYKVGLMSGVKRDYYSDNLLLWFLGKLATLHDNHQTKFYIKDSFRKRIQHPIVNAISVPKDYNLFAP